MLLLYHEKIIIKNKQKNNMENEVLYQINDDFKNHIF